MGFAIGPVNQGIIMGAAVGAAGTGIGAAALNPDGDMTPTTGRVVMGGGAVAGSGGSLLAMLHASDSHQVAKTSKFGGASIGIPIGIISAIAVANLVSRAEVPNVTASDGPGLRVSVRD